MYISKKMGQNITDILIETDIAESSQQEILIYCFEYLFDQIILISTFLLLGLFFGQFEIGLLFLITFYLLRSFGGGIHAPTENICIVSSTAIYLTILFVAPIITYRFSLLWMLLFLFAILVIITIAPVESPNKPLSILQRRRMRQKCFVCCAAIILCFMFLYTQNLRLYYGTIAICAILVAGSMILGKLVYQNTSPRHTSF